MEKKAKNYLTDEEAAQYTIKNVMGGDDNWQPDMLCEACDAPTVSVSNGKLTWQPVPYAICYVVTKNGVVAGFTKDTSFGGYTAGDKWQVQAVNEYGGLSPKATATTTTSITPSYIGRMESIYRLDGRSCNQSQKGLNIVRYADNSVRKVIR